MITKFPTYVLLCCLSLLAVACDSIDHDDPLRDVRSLTESEQHLVHADNSFGMNVYKALHAEAPEDNLFISPLSMSMALGMALNGAEGETLQEMQEVLLKADLTQEAINESYKSLISLLSGLDPAVTLTIANSIWYREGFNVNDEFLTTNRTFFDAEVTALDFTAPEAVDDINSWVDNKTNGLIETIIESIDSETLMYLINAVYFKGDWTYQFDPEYTEDAPFNNLNDAPTDVPMMALRGAFPYYYSEEAAYIELPYGDSLYTMTIVLPHDNDQMNALLADPDGRFLRNFTERQDYETVDLFLPKFELEYDISLGSVLQTLGMQKAFIPQQADFSRINDQQDLYISQALHKTFVEVTEEGTEAAAVTAVIIGTTSVGEDITPVFRVDKPFLFFIQEKTSGSLIFAGKITNL